METKIDAADAVTLLRGALVQAEYAIKGREHTGFITKALAATEHVAGINAAPVAQQKMNTDQAREFLVGWMRENFPTDRTFTRYINDKLAGDFAWQLATALAAIAQPAVHGEAEVLSPLDYRAQGREEALAIILAEDPEDPFAECTSSSANGDCGDYSTHWDEDALRALLAIGDRTHDAYDRAEAAYYDAIGMKDSARWEMNMVERAPFYKPLTEFLSKHKAWDLMASLKRAALFPAPPAWQSDAQNAKRYQTVKTMTAEQLLVWCGLYGFADCAVDAFRAAMSAYGATPTPGAK